MPILLLLAAAFTLISPAFRPGTALPAGAGGQANGYVAGVNSAGARRFTGYCPPPGDAPHAYRFTLYATDFTPEALPPALTRDALLRALAGHVKGRAVLVGRYGQ